MSAPVFKPMSVEEYLRTEETSPYKREYVGGFVYPLHGTTRAQAGASRNHVRITVNITRELSTRAQGTDCFVYSSDMKLYIEGARTFYYPDVMVVCGPTDPDAPDTYETAPCLLVEVTSRSTVRNDRHAKYQAYTALPSLQTYLIVEQHERRVYAYHRQGRTWKLQELASSGTVDLPCLGHTLSLDDVYTGVPV
ncbi:Uma2 family endonuclease [Deinococcus pimensis]|uniref:Uma2 family endonuclease n=1 Tax=Deinococcus pimensis TaxID=309888 RepID=UPI000485B35B|nr:Uma2 family endonuclease [Deinococcus pimensis]